MTAGCLSLSLHGCDQLGTQVAHLGSQMFEFGVHFGSHVSELGLHFGAQLVHPSATMRTAAILKNAESFEERPNRSDVAAAATTPLPRRFTD